MAQRELATPCEGMACDRLLAPWRWLVPGDMPPVMIGIFGDWVFGARDGSFWHLDLLESRLHKIATDAHDFAARKDTPQNRDAWFRADWADVALSSGLVPNTNECLGWKVAPILGGAFALDNIGVVPLATDQTATAALFQHIYEATQPTSSSP